MENSEAVKTAIEDRGKVLIWNCGHLDYLGTYVGCLHVHDIVRMCIKLTWPLFLSPPPPPILTYRTLLVHVTDVTIASRTMLMNIHTLQWDPELCRQVM